MPHWTQTPEGKQRMAEIMRQRHANKSAKSRKQKRAEIDPRQDVIDAPGRWTLIPREHSVSILSDDEEAIAEITGANVGSFIIDDFHVTPNSNWVHPHVLEVRGGQIYLTDNDLRKLTEEFLKSACRQQRPQ